MSEALPACPNHRRYEARDARADGQRRQIDVSRERVVIRRSVGGVPMTINLSTRAFRGVSLRLRETGEIGHGFEVALAHHDADLSVVLARYAEEGDVLAAWREWARFFDLPTLVERRLGEDEPEKPMLGRVAACPASPRRRGKWINARRPRFLARRKVGDPARAVLVETGHAMFPAAREED